MEWRPGQIALNVAMHNNPIGIITLAIQALIAVGILLIEHWQYITNWVKRAWESIKTFATYLWDTCIPYVKAAGQTLLKYFLIPTNLVIDAVRGLLWVMAQLPGKAGEPFKNALDTVTQFQDKMNSTLTGTSNQFGFGDVWQNASAESAAARERAPNASAMEAQGKRWNGHIWVRAEQGTSARVESERGAPVTMNYAGAQWAGAQ